MPKGHQRPLGEAPAVPSLHYFFYAAISRTRVDPIPENSAELQGCREVQKVAIWDMYHEVQEGVI